MAQRQPLGHRVRGGEGAGGGGKWWVAWEVPRGRAGGLGWGAGVPGCRLVDDVAFSSAPSPEPVGGKTLPQRWRPRRLSSRQAANPVPVGAGGSRGRLALSLFALSVGRRPWSEPTREPLASPGVGGHETRPELVTCALPLGGGRLVPQDAAGPWVPLTLGGLLGVRPRPGGWCFPAVP